MKLNQEQVAQRLTKYVTERLMPMTRNPMNAFKLGFALPAIPQMVAEYWRTGEDLGIVTDSMLDTERLEVCLSSGFNHVEKVEILGFKFSMNDAKELMRCLNS